MLAKAMRIVNYDRL